MKFNAKTLCILAISILFVFVAEDLLARSRSSSFRSSSSSRSSSRSSSWGRSSSSSSRLSTWGSSKSGSTRSTSTVSGSRTSSRNTYQQNKSLYNTAKRNGTAFSSRDKAVSSFKSQYGSQYKNQFNSRPSSRPDYVPESTTVGGKSVNLVYRSDLGGYGYMHPTLGTYVLWDMYSDSVWMDRYMGRHDYYYGSPPVLVSHSGAWFRTALIMLGIFVLAVVVIRSARRSSADSE